MITSLRGLVFRVFMLHHDGSAQCTSSFVLPSQLQSDLSPTLSGSVVRAQVCRQPEVQPCCCCCSYSHQQQCRHTSQAACSMIRYHSSRVNSRHNSSSSSSCLAAASSSDRSRILVHQRSVPSLLAPGTSVHIKRDTIASNILAVRQHSVRTASSNRSSKV